MAEMDLSIIIVHYNTPQLLLDCVGSIMQYCKKIRYEIIVVDNASSEIPKLPAEVILIKSKENLGFAGGNNLGIKTSKGKHILLLNSDTVVNSDVLQNMVEYMENHPKVGISTCSLLNPNGTIQGSGGYFPTLFKVFAWMSFIDDIPYIDSLIKPFHPLHNRSLYKGTNFYANNIELDWITGAFFLIRREVVEEVGLLDEDYFMYVEDLDYCYRVKSKKWKCVYIPKYEITHLGGQSSSREFPILSEFKALKQFYKKHYPSWQYPFLRLFLKSGSLLRVLFFGKSYVKAFKIA